MSLSRGTFTTEFMEGAVRGLELGASVAEVARTCEVNPNVLYRWRRELREYAAKAFPREGHRRIEESRIAELERKVGRQAMEIDLRGDVASRLGARAFMLLATFR
jgi:transposase